MLKPPGKSPCYSVVKAQIIMERILLALPSAQDITTAVAESLSKALASCVCGQGGQVVAGGLTATGATPGMQTTQTGSNVNLQGNTTGTAQAGGSAGASTQQFNQLFGAIAAQTNANRGASP